MEDVLSELDHHKRREDSSSLFPSTLLQNLAMKFIEEEEGSQSNPSEIMNTIKNEFNRGSLMDFCLILRGIVQRVSTVAHSAQTNHDRLQRRLTFSEMNFQSLHNEYDDIRSSMEEEVQAINKTKALFSHHISNQLLTSSSNSFSHFLDPTITHILISGDVFQKHGRIGKPHLRSVWVTQVFCVCYSLVKQLITICHYLFVLL